MRQIVHDDPATGEKSDGVMVVTGARTYELLCKSRQEARLWYSLLYERSRPSRNRATKGDRESCGVAESEADDVVGNMGAGVAVAGAVDAGRGAMKRESTRL